jgi:hypothetical protein
MTSGMRRLYTRKRRKQRTFGVIVWWLVGRGESKSGIVERQVPEALAQARREELRSRPVGELLDLLQELNARFLKRYRTRDLEGRLEALGPAVVPMLCRALAEDRSVAVRRLAASVLAESAALRACSVAGWTADPEDPAGRAGGA